MLAPTRLSKERILAIGSWDTGKTFAWCKIAEWQRRTKSSDKCYVLDCENTVPRSSEQWASEDFFSNVVYNDCSDWASLVENTKKYIATMGPNDWLVVDGTDRPWEYVQSYFIERVHGKDADEFFLTAKMAGSSGSPLGDAYGNSWSVINKLYSAWAIPLQRAPGHTYACGPSDAITKEEKDENIIQAFGKYGVKPRGQKALGFQFSSVLLMSQSGKAGARKLTTMKERADNVRQRLSGVEYNDFVSDYLVPVGGWHV